MSEDKGQTTQHKSDLGCQLHLRELFHSTRQSTIHDEPGIPEARRFYKLRHGITFDVSEIQTPEIDEALIYGFLDNDDETEAKSAAGSLFDSFNLQLLTASKGARDSLYDLSRSFARRQYELESTIEGVKPIRSLLSSTHLVAPSLFSKIFVPFLAIAVCLLFVLEWGSQAGMLQSSGDEAYIGTGGFITALLSTPVLIMMSLGFKAYFSHIKNTQQPSILRLMVTGMIVLAFVYFIAFSIYYGGLLAIDEGELSLPNELWKQVVMFCQLAIGPIAAILVFNDLEKRGQHYSEERIFYSQEHLAVDEELNGLSARRQDTSILMEYLNGFEFAYQESRKHFINLFLARLRNIKYEHTVVANTAKLEFMRNRVSKPVLSVVSSRG